MKQKKTQSECYVKVFGVCSCLETFLCAKLKLYTILINHLSLHKMHAYRKQSELCLIYHNYSVTKNDDDIIHFSVSLRILSS